MSIFAQRESDIRAYCRVYPVVFDKASNARQIDEQGNEYIDFFAGAGVLNFGHNNERMKAAVIDYIQQDGVLHSLDMHTTAKRRYMETFESVILAPRSMDHRMQFMGPTGTNAVEAALKLARRVTGRRQVVAFSKGFHGMTLGALACTANNYFRGAAGVALDNVSHQPFAAMATLDLLREQYADASSGIEPPAAFIVETIQAEGGVNVASQEWLQALQSLAHDHGSLLIVDEIQVGCGRTGSFFSFDGTGIDPDIICLAKGIGGMGTPMAMNLVKPEHDKHWSPGEHTGTFRGQNLSFVAGVEALNYFRDSELMDQVARYTDIVHEALAPLARKYPQVAIRGKGLIVALDVADSDHAKAIVAECFDNGLLIASCGTGGRVLKLIPPLTIPESDLKAGLTVLVRATDNALEAAQ
ncbi:MULTISPECIES: aspartate aminotransferase family protein [unclassified Oceanobacter]|jgi:diaminobutyrate-2-oxoglutarate transaminase|uniref:aspartate aminotransferase family protein n=1 Tax=unclassified Oceanobacter TaxID=2620260 RepID=UPI0026E354B3|nr:MULTISPECIES: aspartate aminotransferase family protein [unclassified Oceanobacter]MDO6683120.1 aspartate aminotransferase family protein [Oceanobacter sp. 5_MG-2023]MDP2505927.1 aspartate aminotransferase family protein [Oceanobacter sp. 3_MG-2023]MDP2547820.1 aspartate aminotransferase family protein [Oceanobacter sp. 4_MG-2023]